MKNGRTITRLTNNSDETDIATLISGDSVFVIPYFQRAYKWKSDKLKQLNQDLLNIIDGTTDFHFLGAVIIHGRKSNPADPNVYEVIDGQQRLTTLYIYLAAAIRTLCICKEHEEAASLFLKYLVITRATKLVSNYRLHSCKEDRAQLNFVFQDLLSDKKFKEVIKDYKIIPLPSTGENKGVLKNNYKSALRFFKSQFDQGGIERLREIYQVALQKMSVVQIDVWDPTNGPKIFDSLNSKQEPMTIGDLVRNEIFSKVANEQPEDVEIIDQNHWQPFYKKFKSHGDGQFDNYFFPYGLIKNANLRKSEVYGYLRDSWKENEINNPEEIINQLNEYQDAFLDLENGTNHLQQSKAVNAALYDLYLSNIPTSTYPFLMQVSNGIKRGTINEKDGIQILEIIESFLVRRAICGFEPTGLHAVFKRLWLDCKSNPTPKSVIEEIKKHKTVSWPDTDDFISSIKNRGLYGSSICNYFILKYDESFNGDKPKNIPWIEHILPEKPDKKWFDTFSKEEHEKLKDLPANLIPLSQEMNINVSNKPYETKRDKYKSDSMFKSARELANEYETWTPADIVKRGEIISEWAVKRWKY